MDQADLFMECEEEELEPWQQIKQDEHHGSPATTKRPTSPPMPKPVVISSVAPTSMSISSVPLITNTLPSAVPASISKGTAGQPLILTQGAGGLTPVALSQVLLPATSPVSSAGSSQPIYLATQGIPVPNVQSAQSPLSIVLNVQQGQTVRPITLVQAPGTPGIFRPAMGTPQIITQQSQTRPMPPVGSLAPMPGSFTTMQIPTTITIRSTETNQTRVTSVQSASVPQLSVPHGALPLNSQTKFVVKSGSNMGIQNFMSIVNSVKLPAGGQHPTIVVMNNPKTNGAGSTAVVSAPVAQRKFVQVSSVTPAPYLCSICGFQFSTIEAFQTHICQKNEIRFTSTDVATYSEQAPLKCASLNKNLPPVKMDMSPVDHLSKIVMFVDDFYYGTFEGHRAYVPTDNVKEALAYRCNTCDLKLKNNIRLMNHLKSHINPDEETGEMDSVLSCPHCYRQFPTPLRLQSHIESVHSLTNSSTSCKICEWNFESDTVFLQHMKNTHKAGEMPYVCQVCEYRSSFYTDVHNHFCTWHEDTCYFLCIYCLKVLKNSSAYQQHFSRHQRSVVYHCNKCRLQFLYSKEKVEHKVNHHKTFRKPSQLDGLPPGTKVTITPYPERKTKPFVCSKVSSDTTNTETKITAHTSPVHTHSANHQNVLMPKSTEDGKKKATKMYYFLTEFQKQRTSLGRQKCVECTFDIPDFANHFPTYVHCSLCKYSTCCSRAYANHMINFHVSNRSHKSRSKKKSRSWLKLTCAFCNYESNLGDLMAKHLAQFPSHGNCVINLKACLETDIEFCQVVEKEEEEKEVEGARAAEAKPDWLSMEHWRVPSDEGFVPEFSENCGAQHLIASRSDVLEYFQLMFPDILIDLIVDETNSYADYQKCLGKGDPTWQPLSNEEVKGFIGLSILMGLQVLPEPELYWSWDHYHGCSTFYRTMSAARFKQISMYIRMNGMLTNENQDNIDKLQFFKPMLKMLQNNMLRAYKPNRCLTIDRTLLRAHEIVVDEEKCKNPPPQIWLLCDSKSGYCHKLLILTKHEKNKDLGSLVVNNLLRGLENKHHQVFMSNLLTSVPLMKELYKKNIYCSSSIVPFSPVLPAGIWHQPALNNPGDFVQFEHPPVLVTVWKDTKEMVCLSTNAVANQQDKVWRRSTVKAGELSTISRPLAFKLLQDNMRGVDICSQLLACNQLGGLELDTNWRYLFWFLVNLSIINSFIILRETRKSNPPAWLQGGHFSQASYRKRLGYQLAKCAEKHALQKQISSDQRKYEGGKDTTETTEGVRHRLAKISLKTKRCKCCEQKQQRHESVYGCTACHVNLCKHSHCFWDYHGYSSNFKGNPRTGFVEPRRLKDQESISITPLRSVQGFIQQISATSLEESSETNEPFDLEMAPLETSDSEMETDDSSQPDPEDGYKDKAPAKPEIQKSISETEDTLSVRQLRILLCALCSGIQRASKQMETSPELIKSWLRDQEKKLKCEDLSMSSRMSSSEAIDQLVEWFLVRREQQQPISENNIFQKASEIHIQTNQCSSFRISYEWAVTFMLQHKLGIQNDGMSDAQLPCSMRKNCQDFTEFVLRQIKNHSLSLSDIGAMDELCIFLNFESVNSVDKTVRENAFQFEGTERPSINIYLSMLADGTMLPAMLFFNSPSIENLSKKTSDLVLLEMRASGFSEKDDLEIWTSRVWQQHLKARSERKTMVIMDSHYGHKSESFLLTLSGSQTLPVIIPSGCSSQRQPLEMCVRPVLKKFLLARWFQFSAQKQAAGVKPEDLVQHLATWLNEALACCLSNPPLIQDSFCSSQLISEQEKKYIKKTKTQQELLNTLTETMFGQEAIDSEPESKKWKRSSEEEMKTTKTRTDLCLRMDVENPGKELTEDMEDMCRSVKMTDKLEPENSKKILETSPILTKSDALPYVTD